MPNKISEYKKLFQNRAFVISFISAVLLFCLSIIVNFYAGTYATESVSNPVTDIILSNTRAYDLDGFFVYGSLLFGLFSFLICFAKPQSLPFSIKSVSLFILIRSLFISLTHLGPFPTQIVIHSDLLSKLSFGGDLFFSGHTGLPFLLALIFWPYKWVRYTFLTFSLSFAIIVLLAHLHYSIDVLSAFFITYAIYHIALHLFRKDKERCYHILDLRID